MPSPSLTAARSTDRISLGGQSKSLGLRGGASVVPALETVTRNLTLRSCGSPNIDVLTFPGEVTAVSTLQQSFTGTGNKSYRASKQGNAVVVKCHIVGGCGTCRTQLLITHK